VHSCQSSRLVSLSRTPVIPGEREQQLFLSTERGYSHAEDCYNSIANEETTPPCRFLWVKMLRVLAAAARQLAIPATVKTAPDTSGKNFPAPSHVGLAGDAADIARQISDFYKNPDSTVVLSAEDRAELFDEVLRLGQTIPDGSFTPEMIKSKYTIPEAIRLGDNPVFNTYKSGK
jgi:hypothetical protein